MPMVALGTADEDAYLSDDSVDPDDMTYEVTPALVAFGITSIHHHVQLYSKSDFLKCQLLQAACTHWLHQQQNVLIIHATRQVLTY